MSVTAVQSRITDIQAQLAMLSPAATTGTDFATALAAQGASTAATARTAGTAGTAGTSAGSAVDAVSSSASPVDGARVVAEAKKYLGVPYVWGGTDPKKGLDCSGLVQLVYRNLGVELPRVSYQQA